MKFTLSWLKDHLDTEATVPEITAAMTMAGLEVEHVEDPASKLAAFSVARIVETARHPNADKLQVCQVDTRDGRLEIVCGAPNARPGLTTVFAPIGTTIPGSGITLEPRAVRGVVSNGMLCSAAELQTAEESNGIIELPGDLPVGASVAQALGLEAVIDFEVTPNRPDWLGVRGIARDLAAAGAGTLKDAPIQPIPGTFPCPIAIQVDGDACPVFAGRLIRGVRNGPSPQWLQDRLKAVGLRSISALVDITNLLTYDRARPLHVYDAALLVGQTIVARLGQTNPSHEADGHAAEHLIALDGKTYALTPDMCVIADAGGERPIGLGGVMGGESTAVSQATTDVFIESAWFDPIRTAQTGRTTGINSDAQYRFARGVDPQSVVPGLELATRLVLDLCGGEASDVVVAGQAPGAPGPIAFDPAYVRQLAGLDIEPARVWQILGALGFALDGGSVTPPSWRRDVEGKADLVEEVARIAGYGALPSTPLPQVPYATGGVLTARQARVRTARRAMAGMGYSEAVTWSFTARAKAQLFGGGDPSLVLANPIAADLDCMRPTALPNLIDAAGRNARQGFPDVAVFEIGPQFKSDRPEGQVMAISAVVAPRPARGWQGQAPDPLFALKGDVLSLLQELGAPAASLQLFQGQAPDWWHPGRSAQIGLGPKKILATFGELHPRVLKALDVDGPMLGFELVVDDLPDPKRKAVKTRPLFAPSSLMPLSRDFAFVAPAEMAAGDLVRAAAGADKALIDNVQVFDVYQGPGVAEGFKSVALEVRLQPRDKTLTEAEIEAVSARLVAAVEKACGAKLRA